MNRGIAVAGNLFADNIKRCDFYPTKGMLTNIRSVSMSPGGCVGNIASDLAIIDPEINIVAISKVGNDANGEFVKNTLSSLGVDIEGIKTSTEAHTSFTDVMLDISTNESTFFQSCGISALFSPEDIDFDKLNVDIFHIGHALPLDKFNAHDEEYGTVMARTLDRVSSLGIKTSVDAVSEKSDRFLGVFLPALRFCDYFIASEVEASLATGIDVRDENGNISQSAIKTAINSLFELGVREVVCIHSREGGWFSQKGSGVYFQPSLSLPKDRIMSKLGVGDAFCAGILYSLYQEFDPEYSLRVAGAAAACSLTNENSFGGMRHFDKVMELESEIGYEQN